MKNCFKFETMQSETKIKEAIYKVLRREIENEDGFSFGTDLSEVAAEIAAAIAPHLEAGASIKEQEVDRDEIYTEKFKEWREKYFTPDGAKRRFTSKSNGVLYDDFGLQEKFKRAYNLSPIK